MLFLSSADFFQNHLFQKNLSGIQTECQRVWIQIRPNIVSGLIWVLTVCKNYQQMTLVDKAVTVLDCNIGHYKMLITSPNNCVCCRQLTFAKFTFFKKFFQKNYQSVKLFGSRSGLTLRRSWSGSKLFCKGYQQTTKITRVNSECIPNCLNSSLDFLPFWVKWF